MSISITHAADPESLSDDELVAEIHALTAHIDAAKARWLSLVAEVRRRGVWADQGARSCAEWVSRQCGIGAGPAREQVRVAGELEELPVVAEAFGKGELSYSKVRALTRLDEIEDGPELVEFGRAHTAAQLERVVRATRKVRRTEAGDIHAYRYLRLHEREDGAVDVRGRIAGEEAAVLRKALESAEQVLRERADGAAPDDVPSPVGAIEPGATAEGRLADALLLLADTLLAAGPRPRSAPERHEVVVHVDAAVLGEPDDLDRPDSATLPDGTAVAGAIARRLCCDAGVVVSVEQEGKPLTVGRRTRTIPPSIRRALEHRDRGCRFPGCDARRWVDAHHIRHWAHGGETALGNLLLLCHHHHKLLHEGGYRIRELEEPTPDGRRLVFENEYGIPIEEAVVLPRGSVAGVQAAAVASAGGVAPESDVTRSAQTGQRLDLALSVASLLHRFRGASSEGGNAGPPTA